MKITVRLSCGHNQEWPDDLDMPGAMLPELQEVLRCDVCTQYAHISGIEPGEITVLETPSGVRVVYDTYDAFTSRPPWIVHYIGPLARYEERARAEEVARVVNRAIGFMEGKNQDD